MNKTLCLLSLLLCSASTLGAEHGDSGAADNIGDAFTKGNLKGQLRYSAQYRNSSLEVLQDSSETDPSDEKVQQYSTIGGYLGFETAPLYNTSAGLTFYSSNPVGNNPDNRRGLGGLDETNGSQDAYHVLGEAFVKVSNGTHLVKAGRQEIPDYRYVSMSNIRMTPITHQGIIYENRAVDGLALNVGYFDKMKERNATKFIGMVRGARVETGCGEIDEMGNCLQSGGKRLLRGDFDPDDFDKEGNYRGANKDMPMVGAIFSNGKFLVEGWNYYADDFVNTAYLYGQYTHAPDDGKYSYTFAAQYSDQRDVGDHVAGSVDTWFYGLKFQFNAPGLVFFTSFNEVAYNEDSYDGGTIFVRWGTPQMFNSFQVQDSELAGTRSLGAGLQYDFGLRGWLPGVVMRIRYGEYDMPDKLTQADARQDRSEATFDLRYSFSRDSGFGIFTEMDGLSIQFRLAYNNYDTELDFDKFKEIHGYEFDAVTKDFVDARVYVDYLF